MATLNSAPPLLRFSPKRPSSLAPHLSFNNLRKPQLGFESKTTPTRLERKVREGLWQRKIKRQWCVRCTADGIDGGMFVGGRKEGVAFSIPERLKVVSLVACVMCLCNADRVVMSVAIVPLAAKHGWSNSFLGIVQVFLITTKFFIMNKFIALSLSFSHIHIESIICVIND